MVWDLAWRLFRHEARRGELSIILAAIVLSVAAVLSLSLFSERLQSALTERTAQFMAADRVLEVSNQQAPEEWINQAKSLGLATARQAYTRSMAFANDELLLVNLRAAGAGYPLKGELEVANTPFEVGEVTQQLPGSGEVWAESRVFQELRLELGDVIEIGDREFVLSKVLVAVPDAGFGLFDTNPKVLIAFADFASTGLTGPGGRVGYSYFFTGNSTQLSDYYDWLQPRLTSDIHDWESIEDDESGIGQAVNRAEQYFLLASLLAIVLAAVSIAVAAQRYSQRHFDPVAIMKTLGASKRTVQQIYLLQIAFITLLGIVLGSVIGLALQQAVVWAISEQMQVELSSWHWRPLLMAVFTGLTCALLFSLYPLLRLFSVPPLRVLRRDLGANLSSRLLQFVAAGGAVFLLMLIYSQNLQISLILFVVGIVLVAALVGASFGLIWLGRKLGQGSMGAWQLAWARIHRRALDNSVQLISFSLTITLLLIVLVMRNDMVRQWQDQLPQGTPNYFLTNVTQQQLPALQAHFEQQQVPIERFYPFLRSRFVAVNDEKVATELTKETEEQSEQSDRRRGLGREANLTYDLTLQNENVIVQGQWLTPHVEGEPYQVSVESGVAERLQLKMGDVLTFNIGSEVVQATITSIREVNWQTMQPNFFFVLQPAALQGYSTTFISSFYLPDSDKASLAGLMRPFANVTLFDIGARINQLREIVQQVSLAVEFILVLVLCAGALVLVAQVQASMDERQQELAILRTLGAKGRLIRASVLIEFIIIGVVAGLMAAFANEFSLYLLQSQIFDMQGRFHWQYWLVAPVVGAVLVGLLGAVSCRRLLSLNTSHLLRQMV